jgi:hypothetical protein
MSGSSCVGSDRSLRLDQHDLTRIGRHIGLAVLMPRDLEAGKTRRPPGRFGGPESLSMVPGYVQGGTRAVPGWQGDANRLSQYCECLFCAGIGGGRVGARMPSGLGHFVPGKRRHGVGFGRLIQASASPPTRRDGERVRVDCARRAWYSAPPGSEAERRQALAVKCAGLAALALGAET